MVWRGASSPTRATRGRCAPPAAWTTRSTERTRCCSSCGSVARRPDTVTSPGRWTAAAWVRRPPVPAVWPRRCGRCPWCWTSPTACARANPDAWIVDFTNPVGIVTRALLQAGHRAVGLCNVAIGLQRYFAGLLEVAPDTLRLEHVGLNHLTWERGVRLLDADGRPGPDLLPGLLEEHGPAVAAHLDLPLDLLRHLGVVPSYYLRYFYAHDAVVAEQRTSADPGLPGGGDGGEAAGDVRRPRARREAVPAAGARRRVLLGGGRGPGGVPDAGPGGRPGRQRPQRRRPAVPARRRGRGGAGDGRLHGRHARCRSRRWSRCTPG